MTAFSGVTSTRVADGTGPAMPALSFAWDGAATPTLTVTEVAGGALAATVSGQALIGDSAPPALLSAAASTGKHPREAILA